MQIIKSSTLTWIDIQGPSYKDIHKLVQDFGVHPVLANRLKDPTLRPMVEEIDNFLFIVLHFPIFNEEKQTSESTEIDFIITPSMILTTRYSDIEPFDNVLKKCSSLSLTNGEHCLGKGPMFLFYYIVKELFNFSLREIDHIHEKISKIEEGIFEGKEKEMVPLLSTVRRDIINFLAILEPQKIALESLLRINHQVDSFTRPYINELTVEYHKIFSFIKSEKETLTALHDTNESLLNVKTNEVMKTLTIMAFITFPLMLLSSLFGMNTEVLPIVGAENDFWIIVGIMVIATILFFSFFKKKKWL